MNVPTAGVQFDWAVETEQETGQRYATAEAVPSSDFPTHFEQVRANVRPSHLLLGGASDFTYGELFDRVSRLNSLYRKIGLAVGDRVLIASKNDREVVALYLSMLQSGLTAVVVDPRSTPDEVAVLLQAVDPSAIFMDSDLAQNVRRGIASSARVLFEIRDKGADRKSFLGMFSRSEGQGQADAGYPALLDPLAPSFRPLGVIPETTTALILFTSGTTSRPKGIELTHKGICAQFRTFARHYGFDANSRILNHLPFHHTDGLNLGAAIAFWAEASLYRPAQFSVQSLPDFLHAIYRSRITHAVTVPTVLGLISRLSADLDDSFRTDHFRFVISTAGPLEDRLWKEFEARFGVMVVNSYGLTETVSEAIYCGPTLETRKLGTIGKPVDCEARIVDEQARDVAPGMVGELVLRADHIMKGYFRNPEETAKVLRDGWFFTGDLASCDEEGFYRIVGRKKNVVIRGGINVYPDDVTHVLLAIPGISDAVTFGLSDETVGERVVSCITLDGSLEVTTESAVAYCREKLAPEKIPSEVYILESLPRGPSGKVQIQAVKQIVQQLATQGSSHKHDELDRQLYAVAAKTFKVPLGSLSLKSTPENTKGWDSLAHVNLLMAVELQFGFKMTPRDIMTINSLQDLYKIVKTSTR